MQTERVTEVFYPHSQHPHPTFIYFQLLQATDIFKLEQQDPDAGLSANVTTTQTGIIFFKTGIKPVLGLAKFV